MPKTISGGSTVRVTAETHDDDQLNLVVYIEQHDDGDHTIVLVGETEVRDLIDMLKRTLPDT